MNNYKQYSVYVIELDQEVSFLEFDKLRIEQVLTNYISNALKFTESGGDIIIRSKLVTSENELTGEENAAIQISVSDSGVGIPPEEQDKVFNKYEQTEAGKDETAFGSY